MKRWLGLLLCVVGLLGGPCLSLAEASEPLTAFGYLQRYHEAQSEAEKEDLVAEAYSSLGTAPLELALSLLHSGPFPADFSGATVEDFIVRAQALSPPSPESLEDLDAEHPQQAQVLMRMAGIGFQDLFEMGLLPYVRESANALIADWLAEDWNAWPDAMGYLDEGEAYGGWSVEIPQTRMQQDVPWGVNITPVPENTGQVLLAGQSAQDGEPYYSIPLDALAWLPLDWRPQTPFTAKYVIEIRQSETRVAQYTNGKGAYQRDLTATAYQAASGEVLWSETFLGEGPPAVVSGNSEGRGALPDREEVYRAALAGFSETVAGR